MTRLLSVYELEQQKRRDVQFSDWDAFNAEARASIAKHYEADLKDDDLIDLRTGGWVR